ncbi:hypothetical protein ZOSMA_205G00340 [Zostera marina]|uniref:HTH La-type RNA-binding domain-containing protein n=1 Tax=Zostera marina TaxID=29655 RepID=A0A0K9PNQ0_ZOSMR|nr:hypothetical protein ZOSMA_205G00340 [Zostera marina]
MADVKISDKTEFESTEQTQSMVIYNTDMFDGLSPLHESESKNEIEDNKISGSGEGSSSQTNFSQTSDSDHVVDLNGDGQRLMVSDNIKKEDKSNDFGKIISIGSNSTREKKEIEEVRKKKMSFIASSSSSAQGSSRPYRISGNFDSNRTFNTSGHSSTQNQQYGNNHHRISSPGIGLNGIPPFLGNQPNFSSNHLLCPIIPNVVTPHPMEMDYCSYLVDYSTGQPFMMHSYYDYRNPPLMSNPYGIFNSSVNFYPPPTVPQDHNYTWRSNSQIPIRHYNQPQQYYNPFPFSDISQRPYLMTMQPQPFISPHGVHGNHGYNAHHSTSQYTNPNYIRELKKDVREQIEYYFGDFNYRDDKHLHDRLDKEGWVPISEIANFNMVKRKNVELSFILESLKPSKVVEIKGNKIRKRLKKN